MRSILEQIATIENAFRDQGYVTDQAQATELHLVMALQKPLLVEGPAGVGKTEIAKVLARVLGTRLIRLQCYEGLDVNTVLYEWNYQKQLLHLKLTENSGATPQEREAEIFSPAFLLRRRCLYQWIDYPNPEKEAAILAARLPDIDMRLAQQIAGVMERLRRMPLNKVLGVAESLDWAQALMVLHRGQLPEEAVRATFGCFLKDRGDWELVESALQSGTLLAGSSEHG